MIKTLSAVVLMITVSTGSVAQTIQYDGYEIDQQLSQTALNQLSTDYVRDYFRSTNPKVIIDQLLDSKITPLEREYILFNLLSEISLQPPQDFHQDFINRMKTYPVQATRVADEGHLPVAIFNLNSKAFGVENIWTAYRTEQRFNQLFEKQLPAAITAIQRVLSEPSAQRRPQWLGIKNSIVDLPEQTLNQLADYLTDSDQASQGVDALISHVGLFTGRTELIKKALSSKQTEIRQMTLRQLSTHTSPTDAISWLLANAQSGQERKFSTSLLSQFSSDEAVETFLANQLNDPETAAHAAFALSQSDSLSLPVLLKKRYLKSQDHREKKYLLLTLRLNQSGAAQLALDDLLNTIEPGSNTAKWLQSFERKANGDQS